MKEKLKYWWTILYFPIYVIVFGWLENRPVDVTIISIGIDHQIPFVEYFIVPYLVWFPFIAVTFLWFFFGDKKEFWQYMSMLYLGMTIFLIVSAVFPNGLDLRPTTFERDNIFTQMVAMLYATDTSTNVVPSIHAFNSIAAAIAVWKSERVATKPWQRIIVYILSILIVLSTVFLKQHSVIDVVAAFVMAAILYVPIYGKAAMLKTTVPNEVSA